MLFFMMGKCTFNARALPLQISQTWHCPAPEHLGRPRDRIDQRPGASLDSVYAKHEQWAKVCVSVIINYICVAWQSLLWSDYYRYVHITVLEEKCVFIWRETNLHCDCSVLDRHARQKSSSIALISTLLWRLYYNTTYITWTLFGESQPTAWAQLVKLYSFK